MWFDSLSCFDRASFSDETLWFSFFVVFDRSFSDLNREQPLVLPWIYSRLWVRRISSMTLGLRFICWNCNLMVLFANSEALLFSAFDRGKKQKLIEIFHQESFLCCETLVENSLSLSLLFIVRAHFSCCIISTNFDSSFSLFRWVLQSIFRELFFPSLWCRGGLQAVLFSESFNN